MADSAGSVGEPPSSPQLPPPTPPRDINPFGQPVSPELKGADDGGVDFNSSLEPPRPSTPPPPPPVPVKAAPGSPAPGSPRPPSSPPPPLPDDADDVAGAVTPSAEASPAASSPGESGRRRGKGQQHGITGLHYTGARPYSRVSVAWRYDL